MRIDGQNPSRDRKSRWSQNNRSKDRNVGKQRIDWLSDKLKSLDEDVNIAYKNLGLTNPDSHENKIGGVNPVFLKQMNMKPEEYNPYIKKLSDYEPVSKN